DQPWYASNRDLSKPPFCRAELYRSLPDLKNRFTGEVRDADLVMVGSYVPEGVAVGDWVLLNARGVTAFYDIDTPITLTRLDRGDTEYISRTLVMRYDLYLSFTGGPTLERLEERYHAPRARVLYCSVDPEKYYPEDCEGEWDLGYLGTYSEDRQPALQQLMLRPASRWGEGRFIVAGPMYPNGNGWPCNVKRLEHLGPAHHRAFYNSQRFTLNITRADMVRAGYSPSVRLFEAAACGTPIISDCWSGLNDVFDTGSEILVSRSPEDTLAFLREIPERERVLIGSRARARVLKEHTADHRAAQLEQYAAELSGEQVLPAAARNAGM
ncbi:MAG: CgeB family protein, partial [Bryobacteraceae bacterium]